MSESPHHRIAFMRHAESTYSSVYPDITEAGIRQLEQTANELRSFLSVPHRIIASPAVRAQGSAHILVQAMGFASEIITEPLLSDMAYADWPSAKHIFEECRKECGGVENVYDMDDRFEDASIFEPRSSVRGRFYAFLEALTKDLRQAADPQRILIVSHFEILNHFVLKFLPDAPWLGPARSFRLQLEPGDSKARFKGSLLYETFAKDGLFF